MGRKRYVLAQDPREEWTLHELPEPHDRWLGGPAFVDLYSTLDHGLEHHTINGLNDALALNQWVEHNL